MRFSWKLFFSILTIYTSSLFGAFEPTAGGGNIADCLIKEFDKVVGETEFRKIRIDKVFSYTFGGGYTFTALAKEDFEALRLRSGNRRMTYRTGDKFSGHINAVEQKLYVYNPAKVKTELEGIRCDLHVGEETAFRINDSGDHAIFEVAGTSSRVYGRITYMGCFAAGTKILTPNGKVSIETLREGDSVLSMSPDGRIVTTKVLATFVHENTTWEVKIRLSDGKNLTITTTGEHPFFLAGKSMATVTVDKLRTGMKLIYTDGRNLTETSEIIEVTQKGQKAKVYNFTAGTYHNYFVDGILVHNKT